MSSSPFSDLSDEISSLHQHVQDGFRSDAERLRDLERIVLLLKERGVKSAEVTTASSTGSLAARPLKAIISPSQLNLLQSEKESLTTEVLTLKSELNGMDIVLKQNAQLELEVARLLEEVDEATKGVLCRGFLYKWRSHEISVRNRNLLYQYFLK